MHTLPFTASGCARRALELGALAAAAMFSAACGSPDPAELPFFPMPVNDPPAVVMPLGGSPQSGPADAWLTAVEFGDFQCPYCVRVQPTLDEIRARYGDDLRIVWKNLPLDFHDRAMPAAIAAVCAAQFGEFWSMYEAIYDFAALSDAALHEFAALLISTDLLPAWEACLSTQAPRDRIAADKALAAEAGIRGTPTLVINGRIVVGAASFDEYRAVFDRELARAKESGVPRERYYDQVVLGL